MSFCADISLAKASVNAAIAPSVNPAGGGILYVKDGVLNYQGLNRMRTALAPVDSALLW